MSDFWFGFTVATLLLLLSTIAVGAVAEYLSGRRRCRGLGECERCDTIMRDGIMAANETAAERREGEQES